MQCLLNRGGLVVRVPVGRRSACGGSSKHMAAASQPQCDIARNAPAAQAQYQLHCITSANAAALQCLAAPKLVASKDQALLIHGNAWQGRTADGARCR